MIRLRRTPKARPSASGPHHFVEPGDSRSGLAAGSVQSGNQMAAALAVAAAGLRPANCGLSGCGKPRQDPIHWPSE
jgi:hypothetical protein